VHGGGRRGGRTRRERPRFRPVAQEIVRRCGAEREEERSGEGVWVILALQLADEATRNLGGDAVRGFGPARRPCFGGERFYEHCGVGPDRVDAGQGL